MAKTETKKREGRGKITSIGNGKFSRRCKKKKNWKNGVKKYRGQGK